MINAIDPNQLLTQMRALQSQASGTAAPASPVGGIASNNSNTSVDFGSVVKDALDQVNSLQKTASNMKNAFEMGDPKVSLVDAMVASQKAGVAFEATIQVRNKMIAAYQEVMRMSI